MPLLTPRKLPRPTDVPVLESGVRKNGKVSPILGYAAIML